MGLVFLFNDATVAYGFDINVTMDFMKVVIHFESLGVWDFGLGMS